METSNPVAIPIPTDKVREQDMTDVLRTLLYLIESPSSATEYKGIVRLHTDLPATDKDVGLFFTNLNSVWPFWAHYLEPSSFDYVTEAICGKRADVVERFKADCMEAAAEFHRLAASGELASDDARF